MGEPVKVKFDYKDPTNVEAEVPTAQNIREDHKEETLEGTNHSETKNSSYTQPNGGVMEGGLSEHATSYGITEKECKDDKKKTKIPISRFRQTVEKVKAVRRESKMAESHIPKRTSSIPKPTKESKNSQSEVQKVLTISTTKVTERTIAPEDEFDKLYEEVVCSTPTVVNIDISLLNPKVDDPEKLESTFEEIIHDYVEKKVQPLDVEKVKRSKIPFLKRRSQQDMDVNGQTDRSNRIMAARDKLRQRHSSNSEHNDVRKELRAVSDISKDSSEIKQEDPQEENTLNTPKMNTEVTKKHTKTIIKTSSSANEQDSCSKVVGTTTITEITTNESSNEVQKNSGQRLEENIFKDYVKREPVFESYVHEYTEKRETEKTVEVKKVLSYTSKHESDFKIDKTEVKVETIERSSEPRTSVEIVDITETETQNKVSEEIIDTEQIEREAKGNDNDKSHIIEIVDVSENGSKNMKAEEIMAKVQTQMEHTNQVMKVKDDSYESIPKLRGKVGSLISKIDSHETEAQKNDYMSELPKKKSVLSKIAIFERQEVKPSVTKTESHKKESKLPNLITKGINIEGHTHVHTPLIVEEVFKPFPVTINTDESCNKVEITSNSDGDVKDIVRAEAFMIESPEIVRYDVENKLQIQSDTLFTEQSKSEERITPVPIKSEEETITRKEEKSKVSDVPVIIPKFIPVREVLKRYESLNETKLTQNIEVKLDSTSHLKEVYPEKRPISEIINNLKPEEDMKPLKTHQVSKVISDSKPTNDITYEVDNEVFIETVRQPVMNSVVNHIQNPNKKEDIQNVFIPKTRGLSSYSTKQDEDFESFKSLDNDLKIHKSRYNDDIRRAKSVAELDLEDAVKGKVNRMIGRLNSFERVEVETKETPINIKEMPRKRSVSEKIALFENKLTVAKAVVQPPRVHKLRIERSAEKPAEITKVRATKPTTTKEEPSTEDIQKKIEELTTAKQTYGKMDVPRMKLSNGINMPVIAVGTALLDPSLTFHVIAAAIDMGYRAIDTAFIYGNERAVGEAVRAKIADGTVTREELFIISKLWSTFHRTDLVRTACQASLDAMGLDYFDLYLMHNPMSLKEGGAPIPKIATVLQYSEHDYIDAWFGMETLGARARCLGVSNFNSVQLRRVMDRARIKPAVNQVECHPYLAQQRLDHFCSDHNISLSCFGVLGSKGTPSEFKSGQPAAIDDALVQVMASGLGVSPAQLLIRYQIECGHNVVVKASSAAHLWDNLQALTFTLTPGQVDALHALNRNKRIFTFKGMGDTHKNYPFNVAF